MPTSTSGIVPLVALLFAAPLLSCAAEVVEDAPAPVASIVTTFGGELEESKARGRGAVNGGGPDATLAYLAGTSLRVSPDATEGGELDPFAFELDAPSGGHVDRPDFSALARRGYSFGYAQGDFLRSPTYATTSRGDVFYFEGFVHGARSGYAVAHAAPGRDAEVVEVTTNADAFFPSAILVRGPDDVFVGAATVKAGSFGPDFPGCPISILHGQNGVYLAHVDGSGLHEIR